MKYDPIYFTDKAYSPHLAYWKKKAALLEDNYQYIFKQTWSSYAYDKKPAKIRMTLPDGVVQKLRDLSGEDESGLFVLLLSGLYLLLNKYGKQDTIGILTPHFDAGVDADAFENNEVPLIAMVNEQLSVKELIYAVRETVSESYNFQEFPVAGISDKFRSDVFVYSPDIHRKGEYPTKGLIVAITMKPSVQLEWTGYGPFSAAFLQVLIDSFNTILPGLCRPDTLIRDLKWAGEGPTAGKEAPDEMHTIYGLFERQSLLSPDKIAIVQGSKKMTYSELHREVNKLSFYLKNEAGIGKGDVVGVMMERSSWLVIALLAIMKAGGIYLPVNPDDPGERTSYILEDAGARTLIISLAGFSKAGKFKNISLIPADSLLSTSMLDGYEDFPCAVTGEDCAYIIYTSGSTGKPKGVIVGHHAFAYVMLEHIRIYGIGDADRIPFFFSPSFDASLKHIFISLFSGSTLLIPEKEELKDPSLFINFLKEKKATIANISPAYLKTMDKQALGLIVRIIITGGESADVSDALLLAGSVDYYNAYGPTEAAVCCANHKVDPAIPYGSTIPIGIPIDGTDIVILDKFHNLLPAGAVGEIGISGPGLAKSYVNNPELTKAKFIPHPLAAGRRVYLTGDLGLLLPDGNIEYVGRKDNQVKILGYRIELDEIKHHLSMHPFVEQAVVIKREDVGGDACIVAYIVAGRKMDTGELRAYLKERVPSYMLPYFIVQIDAFPLTINGKIDERALPKPDHAAAGPAATKSMRNAMDETIARIWSEVLAKTCTDVSENFFDMGGTSLKVIKVFDQLNELFPNCVKISEIFDNPTISLQSDLISAKQHIVSNPKADYSITTF